MINWLEDVMTALRLRERTLFWAITLFDRYTLKGQPEEFVTKVIELREAD